MSESESSASFPADSFPSLLQTGSMLRLAADLVEDAPRRLGPYRILERIGEGGMGIVYLAEQDAPLVRRVAIKLARSAVSGDRALARFESERQTLATMNHPNIARVYDAGSSSDSRPYFVMECVAGESITEFCDRHGLGIESRLELLCRVCDGVQHAHLRAVIHRDLKPSNILVTTEGGPPTPKIIDFGVAKALDSGLRPERGLTQSGQLVGTPEYMSPEQAALDGRPVDTRTDVYSLGVVLYELITGERPFEREAGQDASLVDLCHRIREQEPERPSARAMRRPTIAVRLGCASPRALARKTRGDLDAIAMKALAKDPENRYATPSAMAADLERYLQHRPIRARRPGPLHRLRKAIRRHRAATAVIATLSTALIAFGIVGVIQALRAQREATRAETESQLASEVSDFLLAAIDSPGPLIGGRLPALFEAANQGALLQGMRERFADRPILLSQLLLAEGSRLASYRGGAGGFEALTEARDRIISLLGADSPLALAASERLARTGIKLRRFPEAEALLRDSLERRRLVGPDHPDTLRTTALLASLYKSWQKHDQAAPLFEAAIAGLERELHPDDPDLLSSIVGLSGSYLELGRYAEAEALLERAIDRIRRVFGDGNYQTRVALYNLACAYANSGRREDAFRYLSESIANGWDYPGGPARDPQLLPLRGDPRFEKLDRMGRLNVPSTWLPLDAVAQLRVREGRFDDAERLAHDLIAAIERVDGSGAVGRATHYRWTLAKCWIAGGRFDDAEQLLLPTLAAVRRDGDREDERRTLELLAQCDIGRGDRESALARIAAAAALHHPLLGNVELLYAEAQSEALRGRYEAAIASLEHASELGLNDVERLERDLAFEKLRTRADFRRIVDSARRRAL